MALVKERYGVEDEEAISTGLCAMALATILCGLADFHLCLIWSLSAKRQIKAACLLQPLEAPAKDEGQTEEP